MKSYHPSTHYGVSNVTTIMMEEGGKTLVAFRAKLIWQPDPDGRIRKIHELNLSHLEVEILNAWEDESSTGNLRTGWIIMRGKLISPGFHPKD